VLRRSTPKNSTELFRLCPTGLLFGIWESTGAVGGLGVKFQRAIVSEIVGIGAVVGRRTGGRIDPLQIERVPIYEAAEPDGGGIRWTADKSKAVPDGDGEPKRYKFDPKKGKDNPRAKGVPSEINHGNIPPDVARHRGERVTLGRDLNGRQRIVRQRDELPGGVTFEYARHTAVLSLAALRKLHFPLDGNPDASIEARLVLAALGLFALTDLRRDGYDLRSRCALVLEGRPTLEIVKRDGTTDAISLDEDGAKALMDAALKEAKVKELAWQEAPVRLTPSAALVDLVLKSREIGGVEADGDEEEEEKEGAEETTSEA
jgi:CRISPR-associated protein Csb1